MMYTTKDRLLEDVKNYSEDLIEADEILDADLRAKERDLEETTDNPFAKEYALKLVKKISGKQQQLLKAHMMEATAIDISSKLLRYADKIDEINKKYASSVETFKEQLDLKKIAELENREFERISSLVTSIEQLAEDLPGFEKVSVKLVTV